MQKKLLALAVAGLVSSGAIAQSNVTVYGVMDLFYAYGWDNFQADTKSGGAFGSGGQSGSRFGFKGSEDIGNGLKANFRMEGGINIDVGTSAQTGIFGRWSTVGLSGSWGEFQGGRRDTFQDELLGAQDANARTTVAQVSPVYLDQNRIGNFFAYLSPNWNGLQVKLGYSTAGQDTAAQEVARGPISSASNDAASNTNFQVLTGALHYVNGPLLLGAAYDYNAYQDRSSNVAGLNGSYSSGNVWNIGGAYDFGVVRINGAYGMYNYAANPGLVGVTQVWNGTSYVSAAEDKDSRTQWSLGASAPIGANGKLTLTYANAKIKYIAEGAKDDKMEIWGLAYFHNISKRTNWYAAYGSINQDSTFTNSYNKASLSGMAGATAGVVGYQQGVQVGLRHLF